MFLPSLISYFFGHVAATNIIYNASQVEPRHLDHLDSSILHPSSNPDFLGDRSIYNIIWSCLATIFACTWIAVHPNLPAPKEGELQVFLRRLAIMGYLLLAPEMVIMWASRQYLAALEISRRHQGMCSRIACMIRRSSLVSRERLDKGPRISVYHGRIHAF